MLSFLEEKNGRWNLQSFILLIAIVLSAWLAYRLRWVLTPFVLAFLAAYILTPVVDFLERRRMTRPGSVVILCLLLILGGVLLTGLVLPPAAAQFNQLIEELPQHKAWLSERIELAKAWGLSEEYRSLAVRWMDEIVPSLQRMLPSLASRGGELLLKGLSGAFGVVGGVINLGVFLVVAIYLLLDFHLMRERLIGLVPPGWRSELVSMISEIDGLLRAFLRGQLLVVLFLSIWYAVGLSLLGLKLGILVGLLSGLFCIVPYLGNVVGGGAALLIALYQGAQTGEFLWFVGGVLVVYVAGQNIEGNFVTPRLVGRSVGMSPVVIIFALMAGAELFGAAGLLAAIPIACVVKVVGGRVLKIYRESRLYQEGELSLERKGDPSGD